MKNEISVKTAVSSTLSLPNQVKLHLHRSLTLFETLCLSNEPHSHPISPIYALIAEPLQEPKP